MNRVGVPPRSSPFALLSRCRRPSLPSTRTGREAPKPPPPRPRPVSAPPAPGAPATPVAAAPRPPPATAPAPPPATGAPGGSGSPLGPRPAGAAAGAGGTGPRPPRPGANVGGSTSDNTAVKLPEHGCDVSFDCGSFRRINQRLAPEQLAEIRVDRVDGVVAPAGERQFLEAAIGDQRGDHYRRRHRSQTADALLQPGPVEKRKLLGDALLRDPRIAAFEAGASVIAAEGVPVL